MAWQLQAAKQKFSELVRMAIARGRQFVIRLTRGEDEFKAFLLDGPDLSRLDIRRDGVPARPVEL